MFRCDLTIYLAPLLDYAPPLPTDELTFTLLGETTLIGEITRINPEALIGVTTLTGALEESEYMAGTINGATTLEGALGTSHLITEASEQLLTEAGDRLATDGL